MEPSGSAIASYETVTPDGSRNSAPLGSTSCACNVLPGGSSANTP
jgi:hypothetical protein